MDTPFGALWEQLHEQELRSFLEQAPKEEGLNWEAKGDDDRGRFPRDGFRDAIAGMANGHSVGYVLVGASWDSSRNRWALSGLRDVPGGEITSWLDQLIDAVKPRPHVVIRALAGETGPAAVAQVFPLAVPPAMTGGRLLIRTSGRTLSLTDPTGVRQLIERGEAALERAGRDSVHAANCSREIPFESPFSPSLTIGLAPTGRRDDVDRHVFRKSFVARFRDMFIDWESRGVGLHGPHWSMAPDRVRFWKQAEHGSQAGALTSGASFVTWWSGAERDEGLDIAIGGLLERIWMFAGSIVTELGGYGPSFAHVQANLPGAVAALIRRTEAPTPSSEEVEEGVRYLARRRGEEVFEPE